LGADTICHIYGLIASGDNRLAKADFIKSFQACMHLDGRRKVDASANTAILKAKTRNCTVKTCEAKAFTYVLVFSFYMLKMFGFNSGN